jgi:uncharacterized protein
VILVDTSGLLAAIDSAQRHHEIAAAALRAADAPRILSPFVLAELDYLVATRIGTHAELAMLGEVGRGAYQLAEFGSEDVAESVAVITQFESLEVGLADASIVVLARRFDTLNVLTLDERHFRALRGPRNRPFRLLPFDV